MNTTTTRLLRLRLLTGLGLLALTGLLAWLTYAYLGWINTDQPHASLTRAEVPATPVQGKALRQPGRVVVVVLDGLRLDVAREEMPFLASLGPVMGLTAPLPSYSRPSYAVLASGTTPDRTGVRTNRFLKPLPVDTVMHRARQEGLTVVGGANLDFMSQNFGDGVNRWHLEYQWEDPALTDKALNQALEEKAALTILHLVEIDKAGHEHGVGEVYRDQARAVDRRLKVLFGALDWEKDALLIVADHGHRERGGHGGPEEEVRAIPLVVAGLGVKPYEQNGKPFLGPLGSIAPTVSVLLGIPFPQDMSEAPLWDVLNPEVLGKDYLKARRKEWREHRRNYEARWVKGVYEAWTSKKWSGELAGNHVSEAADVPPDAGLETLMQARAATLDEIRRDRRVGRTPLFALLLVPLLVLWLLGGLRGYELRPAYATPVFLVSFGASLWLVDVPVSFSAIATYPGVMVRLWLAMAGGLVLYMPLLAYLTQRIPQERRRLAVRFHFTVMALSVACLAPLCWLVLGFAVKAPLPSSWLLFAPVMFGFVGGTLVGLAGLVWLATMRSPVGGGAEVKVAPQT